MSKMCLLFKIKVLGEQKYILNNEKIATPIKPRFTTILIRVPHFYFLHTLRYIAVFRARNICITKSKIKHSLVPCQILMHGTETETLLNTYQYKHG